MNVHINIAVNFCQPSLDIPNLQNGINDIVNISNTIADLKYNSFDQKEYSVNTSESLGKIFNKIQLNNTYYFNGIEEKCTDAHGEIFNPGSKYSLFHVLPLFEEYEKLVFKTYTYNTKVFSLKRLIIGTAKEDNITHVACHVNRDNFNITFSQLIKNVRCVDCVILCEQSNSYQVPEISLLKLQLDQVKTDLINESLGLLKTRNFTGNFVDNYFDVSANGNTTNCTSIGIEIYKTDDFDVPEYITPNNQKTVQNLIKTLIKTVTKYTRITRGFKKPQKYQMKRILESYSTFLSNLSVKDYCGITIVSLILTITISSICVCSIICIFRVSAKRYIDYLRTATHEENQDESTRV